MKRSKKLLCKQLHAFLQGDFVPYILKRILSYCLLLYSVDRNSCVFLVGFFAGEINPISLKVWE